MKNTIFKTFTLGAALLMVGCANGLHFKPIDPQPDPSMSYEQLLTDRYECSQETKSYHGYANNSQAAYGAYPNCSALSACLAARGWIKTSQPEGAYSLPGELVIRCTR